jgi:predicted nucleic acid-binding protein
MKLYLDTSALNRIFDDQSQARIYLEASAMILVFAMLEKTSIKLVSSEALIYENNANPFAERRSFVSAILQKAVVIQTLNEHLLDRAKEVETSFSIKGVDALHIACAEKLKATFLTCDDKIIKRYVGKLQVMNPIDFAQRYTED